MRRKFCAAILLLIITAAPYGLGRSRNRGTGSESANGELGVVRLINAAESAYFQAQGHYATIAELIQSGQLQRTSAESSEYSRALALMPVQSDSPAVGAFTLSLMVTPSGSGYHLYLTQRGDRCGLGWFTDETGILYAGKAVDCGEPLAASDLGSWNPSDIDAVVPPVRNGVSCPLSQILQQASNRAVDLVENLQRFTATERIEHTEFGKNGKVRRSTDELFNYVAQIEQGPSGAFWVEEYRAAKKEEQRPPLSDTGTAAFALIFHPQLIGNFDIRCEGATEIQGMPAWQLRFEESPDPKKSFHEIRIDNSVYQLRFKGRAWISANSYEVLHLQTDLVAPIAKINLQVEHMDILYAPVDFEKHKFRLWLPQSASMHIDYHGHRYQRVHSFSHFQLFLVDADQKVKEPVAGPTGNMP
jgi:hypothetical protein